METDNTAALGEVVRELRENVGLTQEVLGIAAGYQAGAGVSISRFENGQVRPGPAKLQNIAKALGTTREALESKASARPGARSESLKERDKRITEQAVMHAEKLKKASDAFDDARARARGDFLEKFAAMADGVGARAFGELTTGEAELSGSGDPAGRRQQEATSAITGILADGAMSVLLLKSMREVKPFVTSLAGSVGALGLAIPALFVIARSALSIIATSRKQQEERSRELDRLEEALRVEKPGLDTLMRLLPEATEILDYIAVHGGHALDRWQRQLGTTTLTWDDLGPGGQAQCHKFLQISGAEIVVQDLPLNVLPSIKDDELRNRTAEIEASLAKSREVVTSLI